MLNMCFCSHSQIDQMFFFSFRLNSRSVFGAIRYSVAFNRNLGALIMYEWQFTKWSIDYLDNWRLCIFFENFHCITVLIFCKKNLNHQKKPLRGIKKNSKTFSPLHHIPKMITWPYIRGIRLVKVVLFFFQNYLNQFLKKMKWFFRSF
jgi:hypothetical protein